MSLIDEALKRAQGVEGPEEAVKRGAAYPFMARSLQDRRRARRALLAGFLAGGFLAAAIAGALVYVIAGRRPEPAARTPPPMKRAAAAAASPLPEVAVPPPQIPKRAAEEARPWSGQVRTPNRENRSSRGAPSRTNLPAAETPGEAAGPATAEPKTYSRSVTLPDGRKIELDGIVFSDTNPVAMLNGRVVAVGGIVGDYSVVRIEAERVELRGNGITLFLSLK